MAATECCCDRRSPIWASRSEPTTIVADLRIEPCRSECDWDTTQQQLNGEPLFACRSCGSEWVPSEAWTPVNADAVVPDVISQCRQQR